MANHKKFILVVDTETQGEVSYPIAYDVGGVVCDRNGNIYDKFHFAVRETFSDLPRMATAYYADKFPEYIDRLADHTMIFATFAEIAAYIDRVVEHYNIDTVAAYNLQFDLRALRNTAKAVGLDSWTDRKFEPLCIWCAACDVLYTAKYCKIAREQGWITEKGNIRTSAEMGYRYISGDYGFEEEHRGLDDCEIEAQILAAVYRKKVKFDGTPKGCPFWRVWNREKKIEKGA